MEIRQVSIVAEKFKSKPTAIIQIFTGTSAKEVGDSEANYEMTDRESTMSVHLLVCVRITQN